MIPCPTCCGCPQIGFAGPNISRISDCCAGNTPIINLKDNVSRLGECLVVFDIFQPFGNATYFASGDWAAVKTYIEGGGRLCLFTEHSGAQPNQPQLASYLTALGSSIVWDGTSSTAFCDTVGTTRDCTAGTANIAQGLTGPFKIALYSSLSNGTSCWLFNSQVVVAVEQLGSGFIFVHGDASWNDCPYDLCEWWLKLWNTADGSVL